jgi:hypothetical protein
MQGNQNRPDQTQVKLAVMHDLSTETPMLSTKLLIRFSLSYGYARTVCLNPAWITVGSRAVSCLYTATRTSVPDASLPFDLKKGLKKSSLVQVGR